LICLNQRYVTSFLALTLFGSYNTGYMAYFVRSNPYFTGNLYSSISLYEILESVPIMENLKFKPIKYGKE